ALPLLDHAVTDVVGLSFSTYDAVVTVIISTGGAFVFLLAVYRLLPNLDIHTRDVWRGALGGAILFELSFQILPIYLTFSDHYVLFKAFAGTLLLMVWFYLMANITLAGAVFNWWW